MSEVPEIQGRSDAGVSVTSNGHAPPTATSAAPPSSSWRSAWSRPRAAGAIHSHAAAIPGTTISATAILVSNPRPTATPVSTSHLVRPVSRPRTANHSAATQQRTSSSSGLLWRETATTTGVVASASPATNPAGRPNRLLVRSYSSATATTPISACGISRLSGWNPNTRADSAWTHRPSGGLSTVISPDWSSEANRKLCQLAVIERTAAL